MNGLDKKVTIFLSTLARFRNALTDGRLSIRQWNELERLTVALEREREEAEIFRKKKRVAALREELMLEGGEEMRKEDVKEDEGIKDQHGFIAFR